MLPKRDDLDMNLTTQLDASDYRRCLEFVLKLYYLWGGARGDFRSSGQERDIGKYIHDHIGGKLAEVAVQKLLAAEGKDVKIGFDRYTKPEELHQGDIEGVRISAGSYRPPNLKVQIKETKPKNKWWTIPWNEWTNARQDVYIFVRVDFPLDHIIRNFKPYLKLQSTDLLNAIPSNLEMQAQVEAVYYQNELEKLGGLMQADVDYFFDADNLFTPAKRGWETATRRNSPITSLKLDVSSQQFLMDKPCQYLEKQNQKSVSKYLIASAETHISHPVVGTYNLRPGIYKINDKPITALREDNLGIHSRNVSFRVDQWKKLVKEI
ncbi:MAG: hypothetical protein QW279_07325 [Candidatus Jordarchaeaceae archaeon]